MLRLVICHIDLDLIEDGNLSWEKPVKGLSQSHLFNPRCHWSREDDMNNVQTIMLSGRNKTFVHKIVAVYCDSQQRLFDNTPSTLVVERQHAQSKLLDHSAKGFSAEKKPIEHVVCERGRPLCSTK